ncbi:MAG TPA: hypothetical protein VMW75_14210, partial [Thermoanaerobaculia bacterium]|nr:hypothetical protein [Thermoanaerobaculia bacterium]
MGQDVEADQPGAVGGGQPRELAAAGDEHQAAGAGWQQRPHLLFITGVVQHDKHSPVRQQAPVQYCARLRVRRNPLGRNAKGVQEAADGRFRGGRSAGGVEAVQVHVQMTVGEPA